MNTMAVIPDEGIIIDKLAIIEQGINSVSTFVEQTELRDEIKTYKAAAEIRKRKDLALKFNRLMHICENHIARMNPPIPPKQRSPGRNGNRLNCFNLLRKETLSQIRRTHRNLTVDEVVEICKKNEEKGESTTRRDLLRLGKEKELQEKEVARTKARVETKDWELHRCEIENAKEIVGKESVDFVITDPPYNPQSIPCLGELVSFSDYCLAPGGSLISFIGSYTLLEYAAVMYKSIGSLVERPILVLKLIQPIHTYFGVVRVCSPEYKFMIVLSKPPKELWNRYSQTINHKVESRKSLTETDPNKIHKWQQSESLFEEVFNKFVLKEGLVICDPFHGAGTTGQVARKLGHRYIGLDKFLDVERGVATDPADLEKVQGTVTW